MPPTFTKKPYSTTCRLQNQLKSNSTLAGNTRSSRKNNNANFAGQHLLTKHSTSIFLDASFYIEVQHIPTILKCCITVQSMGRKNTVFPDPRETGANTFSSICRHSGLSWAVLQGLKLLASTGPHYRWVNSQIFLGSLPPAAERARPPLHSGQPASSPKSAPPAPNTPLLTENQLQQPKYHCSRHQVNLRRQIIFNSI